MPTIAKKKPAADTVSVDTANAYASIDAAVARWRSWVDAVYRGEERPPLRDLLDTAALLGLRDPGAALASDVQALATVRGLEAQAAQARQQMADEVEAAGGRDTILAELSRLRDRTRELESILGAGRAMIVGAMGGQAVAAKRGHDRLFGKHYRGEGIR